LKLLRGQLILRLAELLAYLASAGRIEPRHANESPYASWNTVWVIWLLRLRPWLRLGTILLGGSIGMWFQLILQAKIFNWQGLEVCTTLDWRFFRELMRPYKRFWRLTGWRDNSIGCGSFSLLFAFVLWFSLFWFRLWLWRLIYLFLWILVLDAFLRIGVDIAIVVRLVVEQLCLGLYRFSNYSLFGLLLL